MTGRVTKTSRSRACGFIRMADGSEAFFHATDLLAIRFTDVEDGLTVVFDLVPDAVSGARATGVRLAPAARRRKP